jgi:hypothetical protein
VELLIHLLTREMALDEGLLHTSYSLVAVGLVEPLRRTVRTGCHPATLVVTSVTESTQSIRACSATSGPGPSS